MPGSSRNGELWDVCSWPWHWVIALLLPCWGAARVAHSQYCGVCWRWTHGCEQLLGAFKKPRVSGWQTGVLGHKYNKEIFTYFYLYIIYLYINYLYYKSYITVRRFQNPTLRLQFINDLWDSIGWGWTPWHPIHGCIPPCFFIMPPNKGWEHTVLKGTARDKRMKEARTENAERRQTLSLNTQRSISLHFCGLFTEPMEWTKAKSSTRKTTWVTRSSGRPCFVSYWPGLYHIVQGDLELRTLLPQHPEY